MGRNKISIQKIKDERIRNITYYKRKKGLIKKAMELTLLCDVEVFVSIYPKQISHNQLLVFCSSNNMDFFVDKYIKNPLIKKEVYGLKDVIKYLYNIFIIQYAGLFANNILNEEQAKQIEENSKKDINLSLNESDKIYNLNNPKDWSGLNNNKIINDISNTHNFINDIKLFNELSEPKFSTKEIKPDCKNILNNNSINIFNSFNNLIENKNATNINNSNLFNINKVSTEKDIKKENLKNSQNINPNLNSLEKQKNEFMNKNEKVTINNKQLNNNISPNNNKINAINNLLTPNNNLLINPNPNLLITPNNNLLLNPNNNCLINPNNNLLVCPNNNLLISPNNYYVNSYYHSMNRLIFNGMNDIPIFNSFENNLLYFPQNNLEKHSILFQQKNDNGMNIKENPKTPKEDKNEFIGKKKALEQAFFK